MAASNYFNEKNKASRYEVIFIDLLLDVNNTDPVFGPVDFYTDPSSYGTPKTTQSIQAYNPDEPKKVYRLSSGDLGSGAGIHFPILDKKTISASPAQLKIGDVSVATKFSVSAIDIVTNDAFELQGNYSDRRVKGSFLGKLIARNFISNREARIFRGFMEPGQPFDIDNFEEERYIIQEFVRNKTGGATIKLVDPVFKTQKPKGKAPLESDGVLETAILSTDTSITIRSPNKIQRTVGGVPNTIINEFSLRGVGGPPSTLYLILDKEIIFLSNGVFDEVDGGDLVTFNNITRAQFNTVAQDVDAGQKVGKCFAITPQSQGNTGIGNSMSVLFGNYLDLLSSDPEKTFYDHTEWFNTDFGGIELYGVITKPKPVLTIAKEILSIARGSVYWHAVRKRLNLYSPFESQEPVFTFDYTKNIQADSMTVKELSLKQVTRQTMNFGKIDYTKGDDEENFATSFTIIDGAVEDESNIGVVNAGKDISTSFLRNSASDTQFAVKSVTESVTRDAETPIEFTFKTDVSAIGKTSLDNVGDETNDVWIGSIVNVFTDKYIGPDALPIETSAQITSVKRLNTGQWEVKALSFVTESVVPDAVIDTDYVATEISGPLNLADLFSASRPVGRPMNILIDNGVTIVGTETFSPPSTYGAVRPIETGGSASWPDGLNIINRGTILGAGGRGGNGGNALISQVDINGFDGIKGGDCIFVGAENVTIDNSGGGIIWAGGGGAGGNAGVVAIAPIIGLVEIAAGSGGSGGAGSSFGENVNLDPTGVIAGVHGTTTAPVRTDEFAWVDGVEGSTLSQGIYLPTYRNAPRDGGGFGLAGVNGVSINQAGAVTATGGAGGAPGFSFRLGVGISGVQITAGNNSTQIRGLIGSI